ncbi:hypothetical protein PINS_up020936, partial [Pythium insidiosum]
SENRLGTQAGSWADIKNAEGIKKRSNTAQNLQFYVEEQKRLYQELPFMARAPGYASPVVPARERSFSNLRSRSSWGSFTNLVQRGEDQPLLGDADEFPEPGYTWPLLLSCCCVALMSAFQFGYNTGVTGALNAVPSDRSLLVASARSSDARRRCWSDSFLFIIAGAIMAFAPNIYVLIAGRFILASPAGTVSVVVPLYLGELAPPNLRGALGTGYQFGVVIGILAAAAAGIRVLDAE